MTKTLEKINQSIWELRATLEKRPGDLNLRNDLLKFFHESLNFVERRAGVPDEDRSFLYPQERESPACLLIHGAGGSPSEMRPLGEYLHKLGHTALGVRMPLQPEPADYGLAEYARELLGGRKKQSRGRLRSGWSACLAGSEVALQTLLSYSKDTYVAGFSFGGTIALNLMQRFPLKGTILLSPGLFPVGGTRYTLFWAARRLLPGLTRRVMPSRSDMLDLIEMTKERLGRIEKPILVVQAADDPVVSPRGYQFLQKRSRNPGSRFVLLQKGGHVIIKGDPAERVFRICGEFIRKA